MTRLTFAGAVFLVVIAVIPNLLMSYLGIPPKIANFFGGTGALIAVGVSLDTMRQVETYLLQRHYDGFLKKGRIRGRSVGQTRPKFSTRAKQKPLGSVDASVGDILRRACRMGHSQMGLSPKGLGAPVANLFFKIIRQKMPPHYDTY